jgi:hypothetical protein
VKYEYIIDSRGFYVVPWASSPAEKDNREEAFTNKFGIRPLIVSPDFWEHLLSTYKTQILITENK